MDNINNIKRILKKILNTNLSQSKKNKIYVLLFFILLFIHIKFIHIVYKDSLAHHIAMQAMQEINENNLKVEMIKDTIIINGKVYFNSFFAYADYRQKGGSITDIRPEFNIKNRNLTYYEEYLLSFGYISIVEDRNSTEFCSKKTEYSTMDEVNNAVQNLKKKPIEAKAYTVYNYAVILGLGIAAGIILIFCFWYIMDINYIADLEEKFPNICHVIEGASNERIYIPNENLAAFYIENNRPSTALEEHWGRMRFDVYFDRSKLQCFIEDFKPKGLAENFNIAPNTSYFRIMATRPDDLIPIRALVDLKNDVQIPLHFNILNNLYYIDKQDLIKPEYIGLSKIVKNINFYQTVLYYKIQPFFYHYRSFIEYLGSVPSGVHTHNRNVGPTLNDPGLIARLFHPRSKK